MALQRSVLVGGPCKINTGSSSIWTPDTIKLRLDPNTNALEPSLFGRIDEAVNDLVLQISSFTPFGLWQYLTLLFPSYYTNPTIGARLFGNSDTAWTIWSNNGDLFTLTNCQVMQPPEIRLTDNGPIFGPMSISGVVGNNLDPSSTNSYYKTQVSQADPGQNFATTTYKQQLYTAAWGSVTGFTSFQAQDGWRIRITPVLEPVKVQGWTYDYKLKSVAIEAAAIPVGPTAAQIYSAVEEFTAGGRLENKNAADLVISGADGSTSVTLTNMAIKNRGFAFGAAELRNGEFLWMNVVKFTSGTPAVLLSLT